MECVPCGKKFSGEVPYQQHLASEKHKKKAQSYTLLYRQSDASSALNDNSITTDLHKTFHCIACDILFYSPEMFQLHSLTQEHAEKVISRNRKNILNSDVVSSTDSKINSTDSSSEENTDQKMDYIRNEDKSVNMILDGFDENKNLKLHFYTVCNDCDKQFSGPEPYRQHLESANHLKMLEMKKSVHMSLNEVDGNQNLKLPFYAVCKDCDKEFSGLEPYRQHLESANHSKMLEMKKPTYQNVPFSCEICNKVFTGQIPYEQHIISEVHRKKMLQSKFHEKDMSVTDSSSGMPVLKVEENTLRMDNSYSCFCSICNVHCTGTVPYQQHLKGATHLKNMNRAQQKNILSPSAYPLQPVTQLNNSECGISGIVTNRLHLGENKMETDYILPELVGDIRFISCEELEKSMKFFKPDEKIDFDLDMPETKMDIDAANGNRARDSLGEVEIELEGQQMNEIERNPVDSSNDKKAHDILENTKTEANGKQMDETKRSPKVCDYCDVELFNADDVAKHYESVEHFNKRWRSN